MSDDNGPPDTRITDEQDDDDRLSLTVMIYLDLTDDNDDARVVFKKNSFRSLLLWWRWGGRVGQSSIIKP